MDLETREPEGFAPEEVRQALRQRGIGSLDTVAALVLETDGSMSVLTDVGEGPSSALVGVRNSQHTGQHTRPGP